jgi:putative oxidoreductase
MEMATRDLSLVPVRASLGATMLYHGLDKLRGEGAEQAVGFFEQLGFRPGARWVKVAGAAEVFAGVGALLGIGTRVAALAALATQAVAVSKVHAPKGFNVMAGGYEFNVALMAMALGLLLTGPGDLSLHEVIERRLQGPFRRGRWNPLRNVRETAGLRLARLVK